LLGAHAVLFVITETWLLRARSHHWVSQSLVASSLVVTAVWLAVGPALMGIFEHQRRRLDSVVRDNASVNDADIDRLDQATRRSDRWRFWLIPVPVLLILAELLAADDLASQLHITTPLTRVVAVLVLGLGGFTAGCGVWAAVTTVLVALRVSKIEDRWEPFAGCAPPTSEAVARFCIWSAALFGGGGALILPGLLAADTTGSLAGQALVYGMVGLIIIVTLVLVIWPAWMIAQRSSMHRLAYLDRLAGQIEALTESLVKPDSEVEDGTYRRLRSLLEVRSHVVQQPASPASMDLLRKLPVVVFIPVLSAVATIISLVRS
jgi:hypothetical protein